MLLRKVFFVTSMKNKRMIIKNIEKKSENFLGFIKKLFESYSSDGICAIMMKVY